MLTEQVSEMPGGRRKAHRQRRGQAAVLWALGSFLALQAVFHYPLGRICPQVRDAEYGGKLQGIRAHVAEAAPGQPLVIALGSSMTAMAFAPDALTCCRPHVPDGATAYNFAVNASGNVVQLLCLRRLLAEGIRPDLVLVEASPYFLFLKSNRAQKGELFPDLRLLPGDFAVLARYDERGDRRQGWLSHQLVPWVAYRHNLQNWLLPKWVHPAKRYNYLWLYTDSWGWERFPDITINRTRRAFCLPDGIERTRRATRALCAQPTSAAMMHAIEEVVETCCGEGITAVVVRPPMASFARATYAAAIGETLDHHYRGLAERTGVRIVNAEDWLTDREMMDGYHVAPHGAAAFTRRLEREVILPFLAGREATGDGDRALGRR
jgi:hypothetical protein